MSMGEQPKKLNDLNPADIERIGDEAVERMRQRVARQLALDAPQEEKPAETPAPAMSPSVEESENAKASEAESDKWSPEQQKAKESIIAKLEGQKDYWIGKLNAATDKEAFSAVIDEAARQSDKWTETTGPGFVAGKLFRALLHDYGDNLSEKQRADLKRYSWELQQQVSDVYAKKKNEIYSEPEISALVPEAPAAPVTGGDVHTRLPETLPEIPAQPSLHSPAGPQGEPNAKEGSSGRRRAVLKPGAGRARPQPGPVVEPSAPAQDKTESEPAQPSQEPEVVPPVPEAASIPEPVVSDIPVAPVVPEKEAPAPVVEAAPATPEAEPEAVPVAVETAPVAEAAPVTPEAPAAPELPKVETPADASQQKIDALRTDMEEFRYKYAEMDYEKNSAWKTLTGFFRNLKDNGQKDPDTEYWKSEYMSKLMELQNLELEQIKQSGFQGDELKDRMAGMLRYYKIEQAAELYRDRTQVQIDKKGFVKKAWGTWEHIVKEYGKLSTPAKVFAGVALAGLSLSSGGTAALGIIALRRAMGATGVAMTADALLAARAERKDKEKAEAHLAQFKEGFQVKDAEAAVEKFAALLKGEIEQLNNGLQKKKRKALYRKGLSLGIGVGLVFGGSALASQVSGMMHHEGAATHTESASAPAAASAPEVASSAPTGNAASSGRPVFDSSDGMIQGTRSIPEVISSRGSTLLEQYEVTTDDGRRGVWGILDNRLPKDFPGDRNRAIQSLENLMQQKLENMSVAERTAAGFPRGNINIIYPETKIDFGKLLTPEEVQKVLGGQSVAAPHMAEGVERVMSGAATEAHGVSAGLPEPVLSTAEVKDQAGFEKLVQQVSAPKPAPVFDTSHTEALIQKNISFTDPKAYLAEHQGDQAVLGRYHSALGRLRMGIFMMNPGEGGVPMEYDYTLNGEKLGGTKISQVLRDMKGFDKGIFQNLDYDRVKNPLHYDQMKDLAKFLDATKQAFGPDMSQVEAGESIDQYTRRMATAALRTGKEIKGFYKP